jgi:flagellar protein FlgJ
MLNSSGIITPLHREYSNVDPRLVEAAQGFEALFFQYLFSSMRNTVGKGGLFESSYARKMYEDMQYETWADIASQTGQLGIARALLSQLAGLSVYEK